MTYFNSFSVIVSIQMAKEILQWIEDEKAFWPKNTAYQKDIRLVESQLRKILKAAERDGVIS